MMLSGCGQESKSREKETEPESMVMICTGIESEILERDDTFSHVDSLDAYLDASEFSLIKLDCPTVYRMSSCLYREDESEGWTEEDWDFVRPLGQSTTTALGCCGG